METIFDGAFQFSSNLHRLLESQNPNPAPYLADVIYGWPLTVTKIKQEMTNQDTTKIGPLFVFLQHFSIFLLEILNIASQLS